MKTSKDIGQCIENFVVSLCFIGIGILFSGNKFGEYYPFNGNYEPNEFFLIVMNILSYTLGFAGFIKQVYLMIINVDPEQLKQIYNKPISKSIRRIQNLMALTLAITLVFFNWIVIAFSVFCWLYSIWYIKLKTPELIKEIEEEYV